MSFFKSIGLAFKGQGDPARPPLNRTQISHWSGSAAGVALRGGAGGYAQQVRAAYEGNPVAQRAVRIVSEGVGSAPLNASDPTLKALAEASSAGQMLVETLAAHLLLHGNGYVQILRDAFGRPVELFALRPDRVTINPDARGWPTSFSYRVGDAAEVLDACTPDGATQIIHIKGFHALDDHYGLGCLGAASEAVAVHNAAARWNHALLSNAARPSGALVHDPGEGQGVLTAEQFARLSAELTQAFQGQANAGRPMILEGGLKWQALSLSPADMDFASLKEAAARDIALAFGVPPMLLGLPGDNSYANYREANRALWRLTLLPLAGKILGALAQGLSGDFAGAKLSVDLDRLPALSEDRERLWAQVSAADFLDPAEKRVLLGL